jgi:CHAD domain-containing protein
MSGFQLTVEQQSALEQITTQAGNPVKERWAQVLLLYHQGLDTRLVVERVGLSPRHTRYIRQLFQEKGMQIFADAQFSEPEPELENTSYHPGDDPDSFVQADHTPAQTTPLSVAQLADEGDSAAGEFVAGYARLLFETTRPVHALDRRYWAVLKAAARLHRLKGKPKKAGAEILEASIKGFSPDEQTLIAALVRNQRAKNSRENDRLPAGVEPKTYQLLLGLLRLSVAMNASQSQSSTPEVIQSNPENLHIRLHGPQARLDATAAQNAAAYWHQVSGQAVRVLAEGELEPSEIVALAEQLSGPGLLPDDSMAEAGRKVLKYHFIQMLLHEPGTRLGEDIEELHDMRVATRRMRAALEVFGPYFQPKLIKPIRKGLRATGRVLGQVRDLDVFLEKAGTYLASLDSGERQGLEPLIRLWESERQRHRERMIDYLVRQDYLDFVQVMNRFVTTPALGTIPFDPENPAPYRVREVAPMMIYTRLAAVRAYDPVLQNASYAQLHNLRISFKYLRYTLEFFREVLGAEAKSVIERIKTVQDHLGDLNDADVACGMLQDLLEDWETSQLDLPLEERQNPQGIVQYLAFRTNERHTLLVQFPEVWAKFNTPAFLQQIAQAIAVL